MRPQRGRKPFEKQEKGPARQRQLAQESLEIVEYQEAVSGRRLKRNWPGRG